MFPEYRDLISQLKSTDRHFGRLFEKHNELDHKIINLMSGAVVDPSANIEALKKEKLRLKDEIWVLLKKHQQPQS